MAIITISRELATLGDETAQALAKLLNYRLIDKYVIEERIKSFGVAYQKFEKFDEKKPSFWASLSRDRDDYLHFLKSAIFAEACGGNAVFIGRGAGIILKGVPGVFSVFLAAPMETRLERVKKHFHCDDKRARQIIEHSDNDWEGFHNSFFETKWGDPGNYHLALNTGYLTPDFCAEIVKYMRDKILTQEADTENILRIRELTLGQEIKYRTLYERKIPIHFFEASVSGSHVVLYGVANSQSLIETAISLAAEMAPELVIQSEIQVVQEYTVLP